jgi:hypothetical protein
MGSRNPPGLFADIAVSDSLHRIAICGKTHLNRLENLRRIHPIYPMVEVFIVVRDAAEWKSPDIEQIHWRSMMEDQHRMCRRFSIVKLI